MNLLFDDDLVEAAVFRAATRRHDLPPADIRAFHAAREAAYQWLDPDTRQDAFARVHLDRFRTWGIEAPLLRALDRFPLLARTLDACAFRSARRPSDEGADLYVNAENHQHAVVALGPERLESESSLDPFLNHEFQHIHDMIDPAFGYVAELPGDGLTPARQRLVGERYRLLWDVTIDARLSRRGLPTVASRADRRAEFLRALGFLPDSAERFEALWLEPAPVHTCLVAQAGDPRGLTGARLPAPGALCPLCGFATFAWSDAGRLTPSARQRIEAGFPCWQPAEGLCERCAEIYASTSDLLLPPTVVL